MPGFLHLPCNTEQGLKSFYCILWEQNVPSLDGTLGWAHLRCVPFSHPQEPTVPPKMEQLYPSVWTATCPGGSLYYPQLSLKFQISLPLSFLSCSSSDCMPAPPGPTEFPLSSVMDAGVETALGKDNVYF